MSSPDIWLECIEVALGTNQQRESVLYRAAVFRAFVEDDPMKIRALKLACKQEGGLPKVSSDRLIETAQKFLELAHSDTEENPAPKKRGRPKKT